MVSTTYQLTMRSGPTPGKVFPLEKEELVIGRDLSNEIVINDAGISRRHAHLVLQGTGFVLEDLGSTNGTTVSGQRLTAPYQLQSGDAFTLGESVTMVYEAVTYDPDATVISPRVVAAPAVPVVPAEEIPAYVQPVAPPPPVYFAPVTPPPPQPQFQPQPSYAGQVPAGPMPAPAKKKGKFPVWIIILLVLILLVICVCGVSLWVIDANKLWCQIPYFPNCPVP